MLLLGNVIESALSSVGITEQSVSAWLGRPCGCPERRDRINSLQRWAVMAASGRLRDAGQYIKRIMS